MPCSRKQQDSKLLTQMTISTCEHPECYLMLILRCDAQCPSDGVVVVLGYHQRGPENACSQHVA